MSSRAARRSRQRESWSPERQAVQPLHTGEHQLTDEQRAQLKAENKRLADLNAAMAPYTKVQEAKNSNGQATGPPGPPPAAVPPPPADLPPGAVQQKPEAAVVPAIVVRDWTNEDNAQLKKLKEDNISWRKIAETMNWPVHELRERWRAIKPELPKKSQQEPEKVKQDGVQEKQVVFMESVKEKKVVIPFFFFRIRTPLKLSIYPHVNAMRWPANNLAE